MLKISCQSIGFIQSFKHIGLTQPYFIREQKGLSNQNQINDTIALAAPNYVGHQINHVLAIIEEPVNLLRG